MTDVPFLTEVQIKRAADKLIRECSQRCPGFCPPYDLDVLVYDYLYEVEGVSLDQETPLGGEGDGCVAGKTIPHKRLILIDPSCVGQPYYRFTVAHEIGHWVLHGRPLVDGQGQGSLFGDDVDFDLEFVTLRRTILSHRTARGVREEIQANKFAAHLLMPQELVEAEFLRRFESAQVVDVHGDEELLNAAQDFAGRSTVEALSMRQHFGVSRLAMAYRLLDLRLVGTAGALV